ncbi:gti1/pac2 family protein [Fusarium sporotrichioides]|jgi:hypothetical protein|uniref:Gti1/pac2 family protein n=1 Tax=Fusarium sporotrichioides TaxID=5514 RepID=A0A395RQ87_FUSSP|nr:gti1/pac2 family protein [Fusarium sporotrichioides]
MASPPLDATLTGYIGNTMDALIVFEACLSGNLHHVARRPHDRERQNLIRSGSIFVYEETSSGIKRWTDGVSWSPSRILGNFLVYREMNQPFAPGEKKRASKRPKNKPNGVGKPYDLQQRPRATSFSSLPNGLVDGGAVTGAVAPDNVGDDDRDLVGSLTDSYDFKQNSLIKKTISISFQGIPHHLVSYYTVEDVRSGRLIRPSQHESLRRICPREEFMNAQSFRTPVQDEMNPDEAYAWQSRHGIPQHAISHAMSHGLPQGLPHGLSHGIPHGLSHEMSHDMSQVVQHAPVPREQLQYNYSSSPYIYHPHQFYQPYQAPPQGPPQGPFPGSNNYQNGFLQ